MRKFEDVVAVRERVPVWIGLSGASGSGKTMSALRLATGIQRVAGGDVFLIDTEANRARAYADKFTFRHVPFAAPFSPLDYLAAVEHCYAKGGRTIIIDSQSHEHEGAGGVLEWHDAECERLMVAWKTSRDKAQMSAWQKPKAARRQYLNALLQMQVNMIFCFRAKEKLKIVAGQNPVELGWMPIAGEEFVYEQTVSLLLPPSSGGVPEWAPQYQGEKATLKLPEFFRAIFAQRKPLDEDTGARLAEWAAGGVAHASTPAAASVASPAAAPVSERKAFWAALNAAVTANRLHARYIEKTEAGKTALLTLLENLLQADVPSLEAMQPQNWSDAKEQLARLTAAEVVS